MCLGLILRNVLKTCCESSTHLPGTSTKTPSNFPRARSRHRSSNHQGAKLQRKQKGLPRPNSRLLKTKMKRKATKTKRVRASTMGLRSPSNLAWRVPRSAGSKRSPQPTAPGSLRPVKTQTSGTSEHTQDPTLMRRKITS
jgi:hypothetical protein